MTFKQQLKRRTDRYGLTPYLNALRNPPRDWRAGLRTWRDDQNLRLLLALSLPNDANCIDVGAHVGGILRSFVELAPQGSHLAFEPLPHLADGLRSRFPSVEVFQLALTNEPGKRSFIHSFDQPARSGLTTVVDRGDSETIIVEAARLDDVLPGGYIPSLIKIDVEGAEQTMLEGAIHTLKTFRPAVIFEHGASPTTARSSTSPGAVYDILAREARLRIFDLDGNGPYARNDFEDSFKRARRWNYIAHR